MTSTTIPLLVRDQELVARLARRLDAALESRRPITPLSESDGLISAQAAYAIQRTWTELRMERGEEGIGFKIGLTSQAMREQLGVNEPDYGRPVGLPSLCRFERPRADSF